MWLDVVFALCLVPLSVYVSPVLCAHIYSTQIQLKSHWGWSHSHLPCWEIRKWQRCWVDNTSSSCHITMKEQLFMLKVHDLAHQSLSQSACAVVVQPKRDGILKFCPEPLQKVHVWSYKVCIPVQPHHKLQPVKWPQSKVNFSLLQSQQKVSIVISTNLVCVTQQFCICLHYTVQDFVIFVLYSIINSSYVVAAFHELHRHIPKIENEAPWIPNCNISDRIIVLLTCFPWHTALLHVEPCVDVISMTVIDLRVSQSDKIWPLSTKHDER